MMLFSSKIIAIFVLTNQIADQMMTSSFPKFRGYYCSLIYQVWFYDVIWFESYRNFAINQSDWRTWWRHQISKLLGNIGECFYYLHTKFCFVIFSSSRIIAFLVLSKDLNFLLFMSKIKKSRKEFVRRFLKGKVFGIDLWIFF